MLILSSKLSLAGHSSLSSDPQLTYLPTGELLRQLSCVPESSGIARVGGYPGSGPQYLSPTVHRTLFPAYSVSDPHPSISQIVAENQYRAHRIENWDMSDRPSGAHAAWVEGKKGNCAISPWFLVPQACIYRSGNNIWNIQVS